MAEVKEIRWVKVANKEKYKGYMGEIHVATITHLSGDDYVTKLMFGTFKKFQNRTLHTTEVNYGERTLDNAKGRAKKEMEDYIMCIQEQLVHFL